MKKRYLKIYEKIHNLFFSVIYNLSTFYFIKNNYLKLSRLIFSNIFIKIGDLFKSKKIILENLEKINPNFSEVEKERMVNKMWANYGKTFIEYIFLNNFKKSNHIKIKNKEIIEDIEKKINKLFLFQDISQTLN